MTSKSRYITATCIVVGLLLSGSALMAAIDFLGADVKATLLNDGTTVIVSGQARCTQGDTLNISTILSQTVKQGSVIGTGSSSTDVCTGELQTWTATTSVIYPAIGTWKKGPAGLTVGANSCAPGGSPCSDQIVLTTKVHLQ